MEGWPDYSPTLTSLKLILIAMGCGWFRGVLPVIKKGIWRPFLERTPGVEMMTMAAAIFPIEVSPIFANSFFLRPLIK